jgi:sulfatase maturation enzyme AslB (radical SAM superfamily)
MKDTFCPIPWNFQAVRNNGDIRICCQANVTENQGVIRHSNGTPYNAQRDSLEDARNADLMKTVRKNMLNGVWSKECGRCQQEEEAGLNSRRQYEQQNWPTFTIDKARDATDEDGSISEIPVTYYDLRFGNLCNLACRMCGPTDSHTWFEQWVDYHKTNDYIDTHGTVTLERNSKGRLFTNDYDWHGSDVFWNSIEKNIPNIKHVYMAGGEPMMIERHYEFLQKCIDSGYSKKIIIEYNTNMTSLPPRVLKMWEHFGQVRIGASIDGFGDMVEYQRWPLKWSQAYKNLQKLDELCIENKNIFAWLACTVTAYNVFHIPEFMWWKLKESGFKKINSSKKRPIITHHVAHGPKRTNIKLLSTELKQELFLHYKLWEDKIIKDNEIDPLVKEKAVNILDSILKFANKEDYAKDYLQEFVNFTNYLDKARNQNILDVAPQYSKIFDK